jgi:curved DNA-binding protein CbpA
MSLLRGNHYEVLTLKPGASPEQVEKAYRLCLTLYRDNGGGDEGNRTARERVEQAYAVLHDSDRREAYDRDQGFPIQPRRTPPEPGVPRPVFAGLKEPRVKPSPLPPRPPVPDTLVSVPRAEFLPPVDNGQELKRIRESRGVKLEEIAAITKVSRRILEDIENERQDRLPAPVYLRSFLQQYARLVGVEPNGTAQAYLARVARRG